VYVCALKMLFLVEKSIAALADDKEKVPLFIHLEYDCVVIEK
jgi:hypothetical protein